MKQMSANVQGFVLHCAPFCRGRLISLDETESKQKTNKKFKVRPYTISALIVACLQCCAILLNVVWSCTM